MMVPQQRAFLERLFRIAVDAVHPAARLPAHLPPLPKGRLIVLAAGKAGGAMTEAAERHYAAQFAGTQERLMDATAQARLMDATARRLMGLAITRPGYERPTRHIPVVCGGHPMPDAAGLDATRRTLALAEGAGADDLVLVLLSGGASATWVAPAHGLDLADKQATTRALLRSGASIGEINTVRKHLSRIKGGRLAALAHPARVLTLAISDVPGDDPAVIGSGPTVPDPTTLADARGVIARYRLALPQSVMQALADPANETPKEARAGSEFRIVARPMDAFDAVRPAIAAAGYETILLGDAIEGEAREIAARHAAFAREVQAQGRKAVILSGGELTVTVRGGGEGGPNQEYALALAGALEGASRIAALAGDTDGTDGGRGDSGDPAGAIIDDTTLSRAATLGLDLASFLAENDACGYFKALGDLLVTGPTFTNANDFRAILVDSPV